MGDPGLPTSLPSLEYEEKVHGSRRGAMQKMTKSIFLQKKEENKWERRDVGKCKYFLLAPCLSIINTSKLLKNYQDNRTLVLVLKNEKFKASEAQDIQLEKIMSPPHLHTP